MKIWNIFKELLPYIVSIISSLIAYIQSRKKLTQELKIVETNNEHEIEKLMEQHKIDIENLKEKHKLEMESKEKDYKHEKEMAELKSKKVIEEKNQEAMNNAMSGIVGNVINKMLSGEITAEQIKDLSSKFPKNN